MSTTSPLSPISSTSTNFITSTTTTKVGLGYGIAIAISILFLISTIMLASYACIRVKASGTQHDDEDENDHSVNVRVVIGPGTIASSPAPNGLPGPIQIKLGLEKQPKKEVTYNEVVLGESKRLPKPNNGPCCICLSEYKPKEIVRCMPHCNHCFHVKCIDQWLKVGPTCPLCRNSPATTPAATPLSELVPLAFHPR